MQRSLQNKRISIVIICIFIIIAISGAFAGWTLPIRISGGGSNFPRIDYSSGVLHVLYCETSDFG